LRRRKCWKEDQIDRLVGKARGMPEVRADHGNAAYAISDKAGQSIPGGNGIFPLNSIGVRFGITRCYVALRVHHHTAVEGMRTICVKMRPPDDPSA
jgi:hypothetical protein